MNRFAKSAILVAALGIFGCGHARDTARFPDAPLELGDDNDRDQASDALIALPDGPTRDAARARVGTALLRQIRNALVDEQPYRVDNTALPSGSAASPGQARRVDNLVFQLVALFQDTPHAIGHDLVAEVPTFRILRATFAKSGAIEPTLCTLAVLAEIDPTHRADHLREIDEILTFAAETAVTAAANGDDPHLPAALMQPTVLALPLPWLVDRYVALLEDQQHTIDAQFARDKSFPVVSAAQEVLQTGRRIASALARGHRVGEIAQHVSALHGLGEDRGLRQRAEAIVHAPSAAAYAELATLLRTEDHQAPDQTAALAVALAGIDKFPHDAALLTVAAEAAAALGRVEQPVNLYEAALAARTDAVDNATALRLAKLYAERIARLAFGGRPSEATAVWHEVNDYTRSRHADPVWAQVNAVAETALGRGLLSQGRLDAAERELGASLGRAPSIDAYETLTTIYWKTDRLAAASRSATAGLALLGETSGDRYRRAKLERLAADVLRTTGKTRDAERLYLDALRLWTTLGEDKELPRNIAAERKLEFARGMWYLGNSDRAVDLVLEATDVAPDAPSLCSTAVAFLLSVGKPIDALDAVHRGLSASGLGELDKIYMCLWVIGDARRRGEDPDRQATEYLKSRRGDLWYERLAEAATARLDFATLRGAATTGPRQAELAFYGVVLGLDPAAKDRASRQRLLESVVDAQLVMDAEYDLARQYLATP